MEPEITIRLPSVSGVSIFSRLAAMRGKRPATSFLSIIIDPLTRV